MARVHFARQADIDLEEIVTFVGQDDPAAAGRLLARIEEKCSLLATHPGMGKSQSRLLPNLRSHPHGAYVIFYRPAEGGIEVVRVLHGARDVDAAFPG